MSDRLTRCWSPRGGVTSPSRCANAKKQKQNAEWMRNFTKRNVLIWFWHTLHHCLVILLLLLCLRSWMQLLTSTFQTCRKGLRQEDKQQIKCDRTRAWTRHRLRNILRIPACSDWHDWSSITSRAEDAVTSSAARGRGVRYYSRWHRAQRSAHRMLGLFWLLRERICIWDL